MKVMIKEITMCVILTSSGVAYTGKYRSLLGGVLGCPECRVRVWFAVEINKQIYPLKT